MVSTEKKAAAQVLVVQAVQQKIPAMGEAFL